MTTVSDKAVLASLPTSRELRSGVRRQAARRIGFAYLLLLPLIALYGIFVLAPAVETLWLSFFSWNGIAVDRDCVGLDNFQRLMSDDIFWQAFRHTVVWAVIVVLFNITVGLVAAALLSSRIRGRLLFQLGFFLPVVQASIVTAMIWRWIYAPDGILNNSLMTIGLDGLTRGWLGDLHLALPALAIASSWMTFGLSVVILLAGMQGVDQSLYDAATVDGASQRQMFLDITIPSLRNVITIVVLLSLIDAFKVFDIIWGTTQGGPIRSTEVLSTYMFKQAIQQNHYGYGAAIAVALSIIIVVVAGAFVMIQERNDD